jgi:adenylate cyclase class IV
LKTGANLSSGDPALTLRNALYKNKTTTGAKHQKDTYYKCVYAMRAYLEIKEVLRLSMCDWDGNSISVKSGSK